eukprot:SM000001S04540  [mRNA]  locus=s1:794683:797268:+ [translate_table: standard]
MPDAAPQQEDGDEVWDPPPAEAVGAAAAATASASAIAHPWLPFALPFVSTRPISEAAAAAGGGGGGGGAVVGGDGDGGGAASDLMATLDASFLARAAAAACAAGNDSAAAAATHAVPATFQQQMPLALPEAGGASVVAAREESMDWQPPSGGEDGGGVGTSQAMAADGDLYALSGALLGTRALPLTAFAARGLDGDSAVPAPAMAMSTDSSGTSYWAPRGLLGGSSATPLGQFLQEAAAVSPLAFGAGELVDMGGLDDPGHNHGGSFGLGTAGELGDFALLGGGSVRAADVLSMADLASLGLDFGCGGDGASGGGGLGAGFGCSSQALASESALADDSMPSMAHLWRSASMPATVLGGNSSGYHDTASKLLLAGLRSAGGGSEGLSGDLNGELASHMFSQMAIAAGGGAGQGEAAAAAVVAAAATAAAADPLRILELGGSYAARDAMGDQLGSSAAAVATAAAKLQAQLGFAPGTPEQQLHQAMGGGGGDGSLMRPAQLLIPDNTEPAALPLAPGLLQRASSCTALDRALDILGGASPSMASGSHGDLRFFSPHPTEARLGPDPADVRFYSPQADSSRKRRAEKQWSAGNEAPGGTSALPPPGARSPAHLRTMSSADRAMVLADALVLPSSGRLPSLPPPAPVWRSPGAPTTSSADGVVPSPAVSAGSLSPQSSPPLQPGSKPAGFSAPSPRRSRQSRSRSTSQQRTGYVKLLPKPPEPAAAAAAAVAPRTGLCGSPDSPSS